VFARILFRSEDFAQVGEVIAGLGGSYQLLPRFSGLAMGVLVAGYLVHFTPRTWEWRVRDLFRRGGPGFWTLALSGIAAVCVLFGSDQMLAFEYYQF
jgi:hypothetical protein